MQSLKKENPFKVLCLYFTDDSRVMLYDVEEYACGYGFFYIRHQDGQTESYPRASLQTVERRVRDGSFHPIHLKKPRMDRPYDTDNGIDSAL